MFTVTATNVCIPGKPEVRVVSAIQFTRDGVVVGQVDAIYDFSKLAPDLHALALTLLQSHRTNIVLAL